MSQIKIPDKCDKCHSDILMGECSCGSWFTKEESPSFPKLVEKLITSFNEMDKDIISGDHHSGTCIILFKGDYETWIETVKFIKNRMTNA